MSLTVDKNSLKLSDSKFIRYLHSYVLLQGKRLGFYGNFGHGDIGDDASFMAAKDLFGESLLPLSKRSYAFNPRILKGVLVGGGGIFRWECPYIPRKLIEKDKWPFPVVVFSAGINCDYDHEFTAESKDQIKRLCECADHITVRDHLTQRLLGDLGIYNIRLLPDLELVLKEKEKKFEFQKKNFTVGIVLTGHSEFSSKIFSELIEHFTHLIDWLHEKNFDVVFLPFDSSVSENTKEAILIQEILSRVKNNEKVQLIKGILHPGEMLHAINTFCDTMICMRLHSAVFAANAGVPFMCVSYNHMHKGFLDLMGLEDMELSVFNDLSFKGLSDKFEMLYSQHDEMKQRVIKKRDELREIIVSEMEIIKEVI